MIRRALLFSINRPHRRRPRIWSARPHDRSQCNCPETAVCTAGAVLFSAVAGQAYGNPVSSYIPMPWMLAHFTNPSYNGFSGLRDRWMGALMGAKFGADAKTWIMLSELDFRRALDEYSSAEFRLGK